MDPIRRALGQLFRNNIAQRIENIIMKRIFTIALLAILSTSVSFAQQVLTLEECIRIALDNNIDIKRARNNAIAAEASFFQSKFNWLPSLNAGANHGWSEGLSFDQTAGRLVNTTTLRGGGSFSANMTLFDGFSNSLNIQRNRFLYKAAEEGVKSNIQNVEAQVVGAFLTVVSTHESLKIAEETRGLLLEQLEREEKRERAGVGNMEQVYNFRSQLAQQDLTIVNLKNTLETSELTLVQLLLLDTSEDYAFEGISATDEKLEESLNDYSSVYNKALEYSPSINSAELNYEASKKALKSAQNYWMPTLSVGASYGTGWSSNAVNILERDPVTNAPTRTEVIDLSTQFENNVSKSASFNLSIPIFNRFQNRSQVQQSKIQMLNSQLNVEQATNTLTNQVQQAYLNLLNAKSTYEAAKTSLLNLNTSYEFAKTRYENGTIDFVTYLQSLNGKNRGELELARSKYAILFRKLILDIYTGELQQPGN